MKHTSIGVDIEEVKRFQSLLRNYRFLNRVFSKDEIRYCRSKKNIAQHFAVRFAAKEATWKALSEALSRSKHRITHKDISIKNQTSGKPMIVLPKPWASLAKNIMVSLSHSQSYAVAVVLYKG